MTLFVQPLTHCLFIYFNFWRENQPWNSTANWGIQVPCFGLSICLSTFCVCNTSNYCPFGWQIICTNMNFPYWDTLIGTPCLTIIANNVEFGPSCMFLLLGHNHTEPQRQCRRQRQIGSIVLVMLPWCLENRGGRFWSSKWSGTCIPMRSCRSRLTRRLMLGVVIA